MPLLQWQPPRARLMHLWPDDRIRHAEANSHPAAARDGRRKASLNGVDLPPVPGQSSSARARFDGQINACAPI